MCIAILAPPTQHPVPHVANLYLSPKILTLPRAAAKVSITIHAVKSKHQFNKHKNNAYMGAFIYIQYPIPQNPIPCLLWQIKRISDMHPQPPHHQDSDNKNMRKKIPQTGDLIFIHMRHTISPLDNFRHTHCPKLHTQIVSVLSSWPLLACNLFVHFCNQYLSCTGHMLTAMTHNRLQRRLAEPYLEPADSTLHKNHAGYQLHAIYQNQPVPVHRQHDN